MLYMVECDFADPAQEDAWNDWYSGEKLDELLANPGFVATQRFKAVTPRKAAYLAIHSVNSADVFTTQTYKAGGGGRFGDWDPALVTNWSRRLFDGIAESPDVRKDEMLVVVDEGATPPPGIAVTWVEGLDWSTVSQYRGAVALDASVSRRGLAVVSQADAEKLPKTPGVHVYAPLTEKKHK